MVFLLSSDISFPDPRLGDEGGWLAVGGDLSTDRLLLAYSNGIFPWFAFRDKQIQWWCPLERFVIFPSEIHVSHSMRKLLRSDLFSVTFNEDFSGVISACGKLREDEDGAWLGDDMIKAYTLLHSLGFAASVEVWREGKIVGGLYGVVIGKCFFGESMFSLEPSASKLALIRLAEFMQAKGMTMIDCQFETAHLKSMGGRTISYDDYMNILNA